MEAVRAPALMVALLVAGCTAAQPERNERTAAEDQITTEGTAAPERNEHGARVPDSQRRHGSTSPRNSVTVHRPPRCLGEDQEPRLFLVMTCSGTVPARARCCLVNTCPKCPPGDTWERTRPGFIGRSRRAAPASARRPARRSTREPPGSPSPRPAASAATCASVSTTPLLGDLLLERHQARLETPPSSTACWSRGHRVDPARRRPRLSRRSRPRGRAGGRWRSTSGACAAAS